MKLVFALLTIYSLGPMCALSPEEMPLVKLYINRSDAITDLSSGWHPNEHQLIIDIIYMTISDILNSLGLIVEFVDEFHEAEVLINFDESALERGTLGNFTAWSIWPYFQDEFCFVFSSSKKLTIFYSMYRIQTESDWHHLLYLPVISTCAYHVLVLHYRKKNTWFESASRGFLYALQNHTNNSLPHFCRYPHDKFFFIGLYAYMFVASFLFITIFAAVCTVPFFIPALEQTQGFDVHRLNFGIERTCLRELTDAKFERRSCMIPCDIAAIVAQPSEFSRIGLSQSSIHFRHVLKMSSSSPHLEAVSRQLMRLDEAGMLSRVFERHHQNSYRYLIQSHADPQIRVPDIIGYLISGFVLFTFALIVFIGESLFFNMNKCIK